MKASLASLLSLFLPFVTVAAGILDPGYDPGHVSFDPAYRAKARGVEIMSWEEARTTGVPTALVRLPNQKLALFARDRAGQLQPLYVRGLATGYWRNERPTRAYYARAFADFQTLHANTVMLGLHWRDLEPEEGRFDFSYTDMVAETAEAYGLKVWWVLFMHFQPGNWPEPGLRDFWVYNLDSRDGADYSVQWMRDGEGNVFKNVEELFAHRVEAAPSYSHPEVFHRVRRMLRTLARHYRESSTVIATQIGNEEGFMTAPWREQDRTKEWQTDVNPVTLGLFEDWKHQTGKTDWFSFKLDLVDFWWSSFTSAFHEGDPYKLTSFNFMAGGPESGSEWWIQQEGTDATTYRNANIDVIGTMFHRPISDLIWANLDRHYDYVYEPPILIPSEIGIGRSLQWFQHHTIRALERGAQGYAVWDYNGGDLFNEEGSLAANGTGFQRLAAMVEANEDILHPGLPGAGDVAISCTGEAKVSQLHAEAGTLGILYFPAAYDMKLGPRDWDQQKTLSLWQEANPHAYEGVVDLAVDLEAAESGTYSVQIFRDGAAEPPVVMELSGNDGRTMDLPAVSKAEAVFIRVTRSP